MYTTSNIQKLYKVSAQTVRNWTNEFAEYLSDMATPSDGKRRQYSVGDLSIFSLVKELTTKGFKYDEVHVALKRGDRGRPPDEISPIDDGSDYSEFTPQEIARSIMLMKERDTALGRIEQLLIENERKNTENDTLQNEIRKLNRDIGKLEAKLDILKN